MQPSSDPGARTAKRATATAVAVLLVLVAAMVARYHDVGANDRDEPTTASPSPDRDRGATADTDAASDAEVQRQDLDLRQAPADWKAVFASGDISRLRIWYAANTGHEANGYDVDDLERVGHLVTEHDGQVIDGVHAHSIRIAHDDVTIRNSRVDGSTNYGLAYADTWGQRVGGTLIEFVTFDGWNGAIGDDNHAVYLAADGGGATVRRVRVTGYASGVSMRSNTTFVESWVHDLWRPDPSVGHGTSSTIRGPGNAVVRNLLEGPGGSAAVALYADHGGAIDDALVEYNVLNDGWPHYQINAPHREHSATSENVRVRHNRFGPAARAPHVSGVENFPHDSNEAVDNTPF